MDLKDLRAKVTTRTWCVLQAESAATGQDMADIVREVLAEWAEVRMRAAIETQRRLAAEGEPWTGPGASGK